MSLALQFPINQLFLITSIFISYEGTNTLLMHFLYYTFLRNLCLQALNHLAGAGALIASWLPSVQSRAGAAWARLEQGGEGNSRLAPVISLFLSRFWVHKAQKFSPSEPGRCWTWENHSDPKAWFIYVVECESRVSPTSPAAPFGGGICLLWGSLLLWDFDKIWGFNLSLQ